MTLYGVGGQRRVAALAVPLTDREDEVLKLRAKGYTTAETGARLFISEQTVKNHVQGAYRKLRARCLVDACRAMGWLKVPE